MSEFIGYVDACYRKQILLLTRFTALEYHSFRKAIYGSLAKIALPWKFIHLIFCSYVGTLHEINSETSTVALENVTSFGTEGRRSKPDDEIPASDSVYEYIVFRGSDVKDLRIEEPPRESKPPPPPQVPNDPAILGVSLFLLCFLTFAKMKKRMYIFTEAHVDNYPLPSF